METFPLNFSFHPDAADHSAFQGEHGRGVFGFWVRCGAWTSVNARNGVVPSAVAEEYGTPELINILVDHGLWVKTVDGYIMSQGPAGNGHLALWQYK